MKRISYSHCTECHRAVQQERCLLFFNSQMKGFVVENEKLKMLLNLNHLNMVPT